jgi:acylphosphatase
VSADAGYRFVVRGRVQGVGFRWFVMRVANGLQLAGYVRNLPDGQVEVCAKGAPEALETLELELAQGPRGARVESVEKQKLSHEIEQLNSFEIL